MTTSMPAGHRSMQRWTALGSVVAMMIVPAIVACADGPNPPATDEPTDLSHAKRVENIEGEPARQLVDDLASFDDAHLASTTTGTYVFSGSYDAAVQEVAHLFRVRRLLEMERENPGTVTPMMVDVYRESLESWPDAYEKWVPFWLQANTARYEPLDVEVVETQAIVATYIMGESQDPAMLRVLMDGYEIHQRWFDEIEAVGRPAIPVPITFTLYAMHRIISTAPESRLSEAGRAARATYLTWSEDHIRSGREVTIAASDSRYDEADPVRRIVDQDNVLMRDQPKMTIHVYPSGFKDGTKMEPVPNAWIWTRQQKAWRDHLFTAARVILADGEGPKSPSSDQDTPSEQPAEPTTKEQAEPPKTNQWDAAADEEHLQHVENTHGQAARQLVKDLANFDDMQMATITGGPLITGTYKTAVHYVTHLSRVRHLLEIENEYPAAVTPLMAMTYADALEAWPDAHEKYLTKDQHIGRHYEPTDLEKVEIRAIVATYIIGESGDPAMLRVLMDGFEVQQKWVAEYERARNTLCPVPPAFTLYAMHRIVSRMPDRRLLASARTVRADYLTWAEDHIPSGREREVVTRDSRRNESDRAGPITAPGDVSMRDQSVRTIHVYPTHFKNDRGGPFEPHMEGPVLTRQGEEWRDRLFDTARAIEGIRTVPSLLPFTPYSDDTPAPLTWPDGDNRTRSADEAMLQSGIER